MITIRKYLEADDASLQILLRVAQLLVEGMANHAFAYEPAVSERFTTTMLDLAARFHERTYGSDCLVLAGKAVGALEEYNQRAALHVRNTKQEFDGMISSLARTLAVLAVSGSESVQRLRQIEGQLAEARASTDLRLLRGRIDDCLQGIREEAKRRQAESEETAANLPSNVPPASQHSFAQRDPLTGLPSRQEAERILADQCGKGRGFMAVLTLEQMQHHNIRYGREVGDNVLKFFAQKFKECASPDLRLFRWSGPTLIAISNRTVAIEDARDEIRRIQEKLPPFEVELETRSVRIALKSRWAVFPVVATMPVLLQKIEIFAAVQGAHVSDKAEMESVKC